MTLNESLDNLQSWVNTLHYETHTTIPAIRHTMLAAEPLPEGFLSHASVAELELRGIRKKLSEINAAVEYVEEAIYAY